HAFRLVRIQERGVGASLDDERELPSQVVRVLQSRVHALRADRTMDVRGVAEDKTAPVAETHGAAVMDAVSGEPQALLERQSAARFLTQRWNHDLKPDVLLAAQPFGENSYEPPVILASHRKEEVETLAPQVNIDLVGDHASRHFRIGDEEHVLVRRAGERDATGLAYGAAGTVAARDPADSDRPAAAVGLLE